MKPGWAKRQMCDKLKQEAHKFLSLSANDNTGKIIQSLRIMKSMK